MGSRNMTSSISMSNSLDRNQSLQEIISNAELVPASSTFGNSGQAQEVDDKPTFTSGMQLFMTLPTSVGRWPLRTKVDASFQVGKP